MFKKLACMTLIVGSISFGHVFSMDQKLEEKKAKLARLVDKRQRLEAAQAAIQPDGKRAGWMALGLFSALEVWRALMNPESFEFYKIATIAVFGVTAYYSIVAAKNFRCADIGELFKRLCCKK